MNNVEIKADDKVVQKAVHDAVSREIEDLLRGGVLLREIMLALHAHCFHPKNLFVIEHNGFWQVYHKSFETGIGKGKIFSNPSLTAAVEFALKYQDEVKIKEGEMSGIAARELEDLANEGNR